MKQLSFFAALLILLACNQTVSRSEIESKLKKSMTEHLYKSVNYDSSQVKFNVLDVIFFEEKTLYRCEFDVLMKRRNAPDTVGKMSADISKNFQKVTRKN